MLFDYLISVGKPTNGIVQRFAVKLAIAWQNPTIWYNGDIKKPAPTGST